MSEVGVEGWGLARKGHRELSGVMDMFFIIIVLVVTELYKFVICTLKMMHFIVNFVSKKLTKMRNETKKKIPELLALYR